jgi:DNA-binding NarL/FixJ family response regulator
MAHGDDESDRYFEEALRLHLAGGSDFDWARTALLYGQELRRSRRPAAAREHLRHALETFQRYEAPLWIDQAMIELRASGESVEHRSTPLSEALTAQQWEIARLVADGATNREIGERLFISPRTVDHHLRNIFARLGIRSRIDLSRLFDERSDVVSPVVAARYPS